MNRQLKFRIWDKQYKKWIENSSSFHCNSNWTICPFTGNVVDYVGADCEHGESFTASPANDYYWEDGKLIKEPRYITQQYTGLKDRDGKDIYEGDIIEHTFSKTTDDETSIHFGSKLNGSVSFCNHLCAYILTIISDDRHNGDTFQLMNHAPSKKIIGNIFENPELLKNE